MKITYLMMAVAAFLMVASCGGNSKEKPIMVVPQETEMATQNAPTADNDWRFQKTDSINGQEYLISLYRHADTTMPLVKDEEGGEFFDNCVELDIKKGGEDFFSKTFTKETFASMIAETDRKNFMLMGVAFDCIEDGKMLFGALVGQPDSDGGMRFIVSVNTRGEMRIVKDNRMEVPEENRLAP